MAQRDVHIVTGAFGYSGRYIAGLLLEKGKRVRTLTGHPNRANPFGDQVEAVPFNFEDPKALAAALRGTSVLYNTYWIRFAHAQLNFEQAVANSQILIRAAAEAGVRRIVHLSITNPSEDSPFPYFRGKAVVERTLIESGLSYVILRPTVLFGKEDILINNIAWMLRRLPVFGIFGRGDYRIQPVYVADLAALAVERGEQDDNAILDAVGPETYTFEELVRLVARHIGSGARIAHMPPWLGLAAGRLAGLLLRDVTITRDEIGGLMANLLVSNSPATCPTRFSAWLKGHRTQLGLRYASELKRHYR
jgi:NADH dehydrogenase